MKSREEEDGPESGAPSPSPTRTFTDQAWTSSQAAVRGSPAAVTFFDGDHLRWRVYERDAHTDPGRHGDHCLVFTSGDAVRRVWNYPPDWQDLTSAELTALSWKT